MADSTRAFVLRNTRLRPVPGLEELRLHLADEALVIWHAAQVETGDPDAPMTYWAFAWGGGLAIGRYLREHPEAVEGKRVFDFASGSGLCAIAAMLAGAVVRHGRRHRSVLRVRDRAQRARQPLPRGDVRRDVLDDDPPDADVILAGDC